MTYFTPVIIIGSWEIGYALDVQTISSEFTGYNEFGYETYNTVRSEIGELLFRLKYKQDKTVVPYIIEAIVKFIKNKDAIDIIVPVPPSKERNIQPVLLIAEELGKKLQKPVINCVKKTKNTPESKNVFNIDEKVNLSTNLYEVNRELVEGKRILLFDDIYDSGITMNSITKELYKNNSNAVFALTITKTRNSQ